jgi:hypothetical protein
VGSRVAQGFSSESDIIITSRKSGRENSGQTTFNTWLDTELQGHHSDQDLRVSERDHEFVPLNSSDLLAYVTYVDPRIYAHLVFIYFQEIAAE